MNIIGRRIKTLREKQGISVKEIAQYIGVPISTYREWEYGRAIRSESYIPISECLGVSLFELLTGEKPKRIILIEEIEEIEKRILILKNKLNVQI